MSQKVNSFKLLASVLLCQLAGAIGSAFTASSLENWFFLLEKPAFSPPAWIRYHRTERTECSALPQELLLVYKAPSPPQNREHQV